MQTQSSFKIYTIQLAPVDCNWAAWGNWSSCQKPYETVAPLKDCGEGSQMRTRVKSQQASGGGAECDGTNVQKQKCQIMWPDTQTPRPCPGNVNNLTIDEFIYAL